MNRRSLFCGISQQLFLTYIKRDATLPSRQTNSIAITFNNSFTYINSGAMCPAWSPTRWTCCARTGKIEIPCLCPVVRPQRALPAGVGERGEGYQQGVLGEVFSEIDGDTMSSFQIPSAKARWPCSVKCTPSYARPTPHAPVSAKRTPSRSANA